MLNVITLFSGYDSQALALNRLGLPYDLAARVGVTVKPSALVTAKFLDLLDAKKGTVERNAVVEKSYVAKKDSTNNGGNTPTEGGGDNPNSGND